MGGGGGGPQRAVFQGRLPRGHPAGEGGLLSQRHPGPRSTRPPPQGLGRGSLGAPGLALPVSAGLYGLPRRSGKLKDLSRFDASFFGVHPKQAHTMDPQLRLLLEVAYEAILDGGESL